MRSELQIAALITMETTTFSSTRYGEYLLFAQHRAQSKRRGAIINFTAVWNIMTGAINLSPRVVRGLEVGQWDGDDVRGWCRRFESRLRTELRNPG